MIEWITFDDATRIVRERLGCSVGRAQKIVRDAKASGEVRLDRPEPAPLPDLIDEGFVDLAVLRQDRSPPKLSKDDFLDWLRRQDDGGSEKAAREHTSPAVDRATIAVKALYPDGVPPQAICTNKALVADVGDYLAQKGLEQASADSILRAAGRRKN